MPVDRRNAAFGHGPLFEFRKPVKDGEVYARGHMLAENALGEAVMVTAAPGLKIIGSCMSYEFTGDPLSQDYALVHVWRGTCKLKADPGDPVGRANELKIVYAKDSETIAATSQGGTLSPCGIYMYSDDDGKPIVYIGGVEFLALVMAGAVPMAAIQTITHAELTEAVVGTSQAIDVGEPLPAGATVLGVSITGTAFSGGGTTALTMDLGSAGDIDAIRDGVNLFTAFVDGAPSAAPLGIAPNKYFAAATQLQATFIPDPAEALSAFTAGTVTIRVPYVVV